MADLPILFSAPMVRALLREIEQTGTGKTQTRRVLKFGNEPPVWAGEGLPRNDPKWWAFRYYDKSCDCTDLRFLPDVPRIKVGDRLYVREAWRISRKYDATAPHDLKPRTMTVAFEAGGSIANQPEGGWRPDWWPKHDDPPVAWMGRHRQGMHLPRWASRLTLEVTDLRVERLQEISEADAIAEGLRWRPALEAWTAGGDDWPTFRSPIRSFQGLWNHINAPRGYGWDANPWVVALTFTVDRRNIDQVVA